MQRRQKQGQPCLHATAVFWFGLSWRRRHIWFMWGCVFERIVLGKAAARRYLSGSRADTLTQATAIRSLMKYTSPYWNSECLLENEPCCSMVLSITFQAVHWLSNAPLFWRTVSTSTSLHSVSPQWPLWSQDPLKAVKYYVVEIKGIRTRRCVCVLMEDFFTQLYH